MLRVGQRGWCVVIAVHNRGQHRYAARHLLIPVCACLFAAVSVDFFESFVRLDGMWCLVTVHLLVPRLIA